MAIKPTTGGTMKKISAAIVKAQRAFGPALKTSTNPHFRSMYADLAACVEAVVDALNEHGIALMQLTEPSPDGVTVETLFLHESGEQLRAGKLFVPAEGRNAQKFGSALTYARRYSLMAATGIAPEDDDGNAASEPAKPATATLATPRDYVVTFGKFKGQNIYSIDPTELEDYCVFLKNKAADEKKEITGQVAEFMRVAREALSQL